LTSEISKISEVCYQWDDLRYTVPRLSEIILINAISGSMVKWRNHCLHRLVCF